MKPRRTVVLPEGCVKRRVAAKPEFNQQEETTTKANLAKSEVGPVLGGTEYPGSRQESDKRECATEVIDEVV